MTQWLIVDVTTTGLYRADAEKALIETGFDVYHKVGFPDKDEHDKDYCYIKAEYNCCYGIDIDKFAAETHRAALENIRELNPDATLETWWKFEDSYEWECHYKDDDYKDALETEEPGQEETA